MSGLMAQFGGQPGEFGPRFPQVLGANVPRVPQLNRPSTLQFPGCSDIPANPTGDELVLTFKNESAADWVGLRDLAGRLVREQSEPGRSLRFSTENLSAGLYLLDVRTRNGERVVLKVTVR